MESSSESMKIACAENCGNSPKKELLKEFTVANAKKDFAFCLEWFTDGVVWEIIGEQRIEGKEAVEKALHRKHDEQVVELSIHNIITHGNTGAVNGKLCLKDGRTFARCDIYHFSGFGKKAKINQITSYVIEVS